MVMHLIFNYLFEKQKGASTVAQQVKPLYIAPTSLQDLMFYFQSISFLNYLEKPKKPQILGPLTASTWETQMNFLATAFGLDPGCCDHLGSVRVWNIFFLFLLLFQIHKQ